MARKFFIIVLSVFSLISSAGVQADQKTDLGAKSTINAIDVEIQFYNPSTVRVLKSPEGKPFEKKSLSVIEVPQKTAFSVKENKDDLLTERGFIR